MIDLARIGLGIAFLPDFCLKEGDKDLIPIRIKENLPKRHLVSAHNATIPLSEAGEYFLEKLGQ